MCPKCDCYAGSPKEATGDAQEGCAGESKGPISYFDGKIRLAVTDLASFGYAQPWGHTRTYNNKLTTPTDFGNGYNWQVPQWSYLVQDGTTVILHRSANDVTWFDYNSGTSSYVARYGVLDRLEASGTEFRWIDPNGTVETYEGFNATVLDGKLLSRDAPDGGSVALTYNLSGQVTAFTRGSGFVDTTEEYVYTYGTGSNSNRIVSLVLRRQEPNAPSSDILRVAYTYYDYNDADGTAGDLKLVVHQVPSAAGSWDDTATYYYRYYVSGETGGFIHGLKYAWEPAAFERAQAALTDPLLASDSELAPFADYYFEYDDQFRAVLEKVAGGTLTYTFSYEENPAGPLENANEWRWRTAVDEPDGTTLIVYTNFIGQNMLHDRQHPESGDRWITYWQYDDQLYSVILKASPSAIDMSASPIYDDAVADLAVQLRTSEGLISLYEYYNGTDGPLGYGKLRSVKKGSSGTPIKQLQADFDTYTGGGDTIYPLIRTTVWADDAGTLPIETEYEYDFYPGTNRLWQRTTTLPTVPTSQNGSGTTTVQRMLYDQCGKLIWEQGPKGFVDYFANNNVTGARTEYIRDVDPARLPLPATPTYPETWTRPAGLPAPLHLISNYESDDQGRLTQSLGPVHEIDGEAVRTAEWLVYLDAAHEVRSANGYVVIDGSTPREVLVNPVTIVRGDASGVPLDVIQAVRGCPCGSPADAPAALDGRLTAGERFPRTSWTAWSHATLDAAGRTTANRVYHAIPVCGAGVPGTHYEATIYGYDAAGRRNRLVSPSGTITRTVFDPLDRDIATWIGTDDWGATDDDPSGGTYPGSSPTSNNMRPVAERVYTPNCACPAPETQTLYVDDAVLNDRVTDYEYDFRNRLTAIDGEEDFYERRTYDNLDRRIQTDRFDGPPNHPTSPTNFLAQSKNYFDDRNNPYLIERYAVSGGTVQSEKLQESRWYDAAGNLVKQVAMGAKEGRAFTKYAYDGDARRTAAYVGIYEGTLPEAYDDVLTITSDDKVFEQTLFSYDPAGNRIQTSEFRRFHDATGNGVLNLPTGSQPKARVSYVAGYYDAVGRTTAVADYGTNNNVAFTRSAEIPERSDTVLVTTFAYDAAGQAFQSVDPAGREGRRAFDAAGREVLAVQNYLRDEISATSAGTASCLGDGPCCDDLSEASLAPPAWVAALMPGDDANVAVGKQYNPDGNLAALMAYNPTTGPQVTRYLYGVTLTEGPLASNSPLRAVVYPDVVDSADRVIYSYDRQGELISLTDQNGTVHVYDYDKLGRRTNDRVTVLGFGVNGTALRIETTYNPLGLLDKVTTRNAISGGAVLNEVQRTYNAFSQLSVEYQEHTGAVNTSTSPKVQYGYADGSQNTVRPTTLIYPNGRVVTYDYGTSGGADDLLSRATSLDDAGSQVRVAYTYLGLDGFVKADYAEPDVRWDLATGSGSNPYAGLDRFGRTIDCLWRDYGASSNADRIQYAYDRVSNRTRRKNVVAPSGGNDELYAYDGLERLADMARGTLSSVAQASVADLTFAQSWNLDATGNWSEFRQTDVATAAENLDQQRSSNAANEITSLSCRYGASWPTPTYDRAGNMMTFPKPTAPSTTYTVDYDAWNRVAQAGATSYRYDGLHRRIAVVVLTQQRHVYYSARWQVLEERFSNTPTSAPAERQFVWGLRYLDDLVFRDRSPSNNGTLSERLYALQDANWNVTAVVNPTGDVQERYRYSPYGRPTFLNADFTVKAISGYDWETLYAGYRYDAATGLYSVRWRYLHPALGRWLTRDPLEYHNTANLYEYVSSNPIRYVDPDGLELIIPEKGEMWQHDVNEALDTMCKADPKIAAAVDALRKSKNKHRIVHTPLGDRFATDPVNLEDASNRKGTGTRIRFNPGTQHMVGATDSKGQTRRPPWVGLAHEIGHAFDADRGEHPTGDNYETGSSIQFDNAARESIGLPPR